ncbi:LXG domain-containing protein [Ureibacillus composti]|nr:LXG domain-containing protein [Ureibacillus composti]
MKVLDVNEFQSGLERNVNRLTRLESEMKQIETAIQGLTQLEESLKGQGGEALRGFYENCHLPFLEFFNTFKASFEGVLQEMKSALTSLEPDGSGFIRQESLEGEVEQGLNNAKQVTEELTNETNNIMDSVSDIVSLPNLDDSEVQAGVQDAKRERNQTLEHLMQFDQSQTSALSTIQSDLLLMKTWISNIESMMTEGVTDVNFPAEQWKSFALQHPLTQTLAYRSQQMNQIIGMNPLLAPSFIGGANPYTIPGLHQNSQIPLYNFGINGATVSTNFVSYMKQQQEQIATELSCPVPTDVEEVKEEENSGFLGFLGDVGKGALDVGKGALDFLILDDLKTLADGDASLFEKGFAAASILPIGKLLKVPKALDAIADANKLINKSNVDEVVDKGYDHSKHTYNMVENPGPLAKMNEGAASTFRSGKYNVIELDSDTILYRSGKAGGGKNALGQYFTREPGTLVEGRIDSAVKAQWIDPKTGVLTGTSPLETVYEIKIPKGTTIYEGPAANQGGIYKGGGNQIFVSEPWKIKGVEVLSSKPIK